jgi:hypothetical protein
VGGTHEIAYVDIPPICAQPKGKPLSATMFSDHDFLKLGHTFFKRVPLNASFHCASNAYTMEFRHSQTISVNYFNFGIIPAKLSRSAKQHPSNLVHLMRKFVRGL